MYWNDLIIENSKYNDRKSGLAKVKNSYSLANTVKSFNDLYQGILK